MLEAPKTGWVDTFNGIRVPERGHASSFEDLLYKLMLKKSELGIEVGNTAVESSQLMNRLCRNNPGWCRAGVAARKQRDCCS